MIMTNTTTYITTIFAVITGIFVIPLKVLAAVHSNLLVISEATGMSRNYAHVEDV